MDVKFKRPQYLATEGMTLSHGVIASRLMASSAATVHAMPTNSQGLAPKTLDFSSGAKAYQKKRLNKSIVDGAVIALFIALGFILLLLATGILLNKRYSGRALPFTFIGDVSVGGLTQPQIKQALDNRLDGMKITFVDGGLVRKVPITQFDVSVDTDVVSRKVVNNRINPFSFLNRQRQEVTVKLNDRYLNGYIDMIINRGKTKSTDASLDIEKGKLLIRPEKVGFESDIKFIVGQIKFALGDLSAPRVNVNIVTIKPKVYTKDLEDDLARVKTFAQTNVSLKISGMTVTPNLEQKLAWVKITQIPSTGSANFEFSKTLIRDYLVGLNKKYQGSARDDELIANADGSTTIKPGRSGFKIENIDNTANAVVAALNSSKPLDYKTTVSYIDYKKLDPSLVVPAPTPKVQTAATQLVTIATN